MHWNPEVYNRFKEIRNQPFYDLMDLIQPAATMKAVDLGCGTCEQTAILAGKFVNANFLGIDASAEMLNESKTALGNLRFRQADIEAFAESDDTWDLIFSNAALQWADDHEGLFPKLIGLLKLQGQFAVQMPVQHSNVLNQLLLDLVQQEPFISYLNGWYRPSPVLGMDDYTRILFEAGLKNILVIQKVYPIVFDDHLTLYNFISGSTLIPYMERLETEQQRQLAQAFQERTTEAFPSLPGVYAFKRLLLYDRKD
ncbi:MAG: methyltransferase domain-containing protein [Sphingobacteriales bacterium]|nr:MAG: methyltransferase domain-containing protein [Sphingobacteriales bacterium]